MLESLCGKKVMQSVYTIYALYKNMALCSLGYFCFPVKFLRCLIYFKDANLYNNLVQHSKCVVFTWSLPKHFFNEENVSKKLMKML